MKREAQNKNSRNTTENSELKGRMMPQAVELESAIIGAVLLEKRAIEIAQGIINSQMFYENIHRTIFEAIEFLADNNQPVDLLTVVNQLQKSGNLDSVGGAANVANLSMKVVSSAHLEYHCRIVAQKYIERKAIEYMSEAIGSCFDETTDIDDVLSETSLKIEKLQELGIGQLDARQLREIMRQTISEMYERKEKHKKGLNSGITTGLADLNRVTGGWQKSNLVVIAGRPSMGKTAIALHFAKSAAKYGTPVTIFSLEMSDVLLGNRLILSESNVSPNDFKLGTFSAQDAMEIEKAVGRLFNYPVYIDSTPSVTMDYIRNRCRLLKKQGKCEMVIIDYLQLIEDSGNKNSVREQEVAKMSRKAKLLAKELDIPILLLAQLSRKVEERANKKPMLSDLRESGAIEQDADMCIFIYREEYYNSNATKGKGNLIIAKYRDGYTGEIDFAYNESMTKIYDCDTTGQLKNIPF